MHLLINFVLQREHDFFDDDPHILDVVPLGIGEFDQHVAPTRPSFHQLFEAFVKLVALPGPLDLHNSLQLVGLQLLVPKMCVRELADTRPDDIHDLVLHQDAIFSKIDI
jgi:hypothetical protein